MVDFKNHRRFLLRCLSEDIMTVSIRLRSNIKTPKRYYIIKKSERALLNERVRSINNTINMFMYQRDTCIDWLKNVLDKETMEECVRFINIKQESRHIKTLECQRLTLERLCQKYSMITKGDCSNIHHGDHVQTSNATASDSNSNSRNNTSVRNISSIPVAEAQEWLLVHGPNFAVVPRCLPIGEYIAVVEQACQQLKQG